MAKELVDMRDARFVLFEQLHVDKCLSPELWEGYDINTLGMVLTEAEKLAVTALAPSNKDGEKIGCHIKDGRVTIIEHPDIRVMLTKMKAYVEGCRSLVYYHAYCIDRADQAASDAEKARWQGMVELLTPVCKAYSTDRGFDVCNLAVQVLGGYGYCSEYPVEQNLRDVKITAIYEGTNGIQAMDLATRKIVMKKGGLLSALIEAIDSVMEQAKAQARLAAYVSEWQPVSRYWSKVRGC